LVKNSLSNFFSTIEKKIENKYGGYILKKFYFEASIIDKNNIRNRGDSKQKMFLLLFVYLLFPREADGRIEKNLHWFWSL